MRRSRNLARLHQLAAYGKSDFLTVISLQVTEPRDHLPISESLNC